MKALADYNVIRNSCVFENVRMFWEWEKQISAELTSTEITAKHYKIMLMRQLLFNREISSIMLNYLFFKPIWCCFVSPAFFSNSLYSSVLLHFILMERTILRAASISDYVTLNGKTSGECPAQVRFLIPWDLWRTKWHWYWFSPNTSLYSANQHFANADLRLL
jgi:hypothetical protein